jgi:DNA-binding NtrC family response regulator
MSSFPVLIVEDKDSLRTALRQAIEAHGHAVLEARDETEAIRELRRMRPVVVLTDLKLPVGDGFGILRAAKELDPDLPVVVMTGYGSIEDAVSAMREGATDFLTKPVEPDHLVLMVERAIAQRRMVTEYILQKEELAERRGAPRIIGEDGTLRHVSQHLHRAAATDTTVLLEGESGTGKELFARALHALSPRADGPFVAINCAAIPDTLLSSSDMRRAPSPARRSASPAASSSRTAGRSFSTRLATCRSPFRRRFCARSRRSSSSASAGRNRFTWTCGWWRRPIAI